MTSSAIFDMFCTQLSNAISCFIMEEELTKKRRVRSGHKSFPTATRMMTQMSCLNWEGKPCRDTTGYLFLAGLISTKRDQKLEKINQGHQGIGQCHLKALSLSAWP